MKNFRADDDGVLNVLAPVGGVQSGVAIVLGGLLVVPHKDAVEGELVAVRYRGVFELPKVGVDAAEQLDKAYWDGAAVTTAADDGGDPAVPYPVVGVFEKAAVADTTLADVLLIGQLV